MVCGIFLLEDESHYENMLLRLQYAGSLTRSPIRPLDGRAVKSSTRDADIYLFSSIVKYNVINLQIENTLSAMRCDAMSYARSTLRRSPKNL